MRVVVIGAGVAGLVAARALRTGAHEVVVFDKAPSVGGRLATYRFGDAVFDAGAQFFTVRGAAFRAQVDDWLDRDLARVWCHGFAGREDGFPRYVGSSGMASLATDLADGLDVRLDRMAFTMHPAADGWRVVFDDAAWVDADAVVLTCPLAQSWALLAEAGGELPDDLLRTDYHRTIALLVTLAGPARVPEPGGVQFDPTSSDSPFGFVADNQAKGISAVPSVTLHATQPWSRDHWTAPADSIRTELLDRASGWLGSGTTDEAVVDATVKRWRFAGPVVPRSSACWTDPQRRLVLAGDAFAGARVEGAYDSGMAAAEAVMALG